MATEALKMMKDQLVSCVQGQLSNISSADSQELGEAVDMIKDLAESIYYCTITEAMQKSEKQEQAPVNNITYYTNPIVPPMNNRMYPDYRDMERTGGYMYYPGGSGGGNSGGGSGSSSGGGNSGGSGGSGGSRGYSTNYYTEKMPYEMQMQMPMQMPMQRDPREGRAALRRRMYMEGKEMHKDTNSQLHELEAYLQELSSDLTEMIKDASPEERATLHQKMTMLANKIS